MGHVAIINQLLSETIKALLKHSWERFNVDYRTGDNAKLYD